MHMMSSCTVPLTPVVCLEYRAIIIILHPHSFNYYITTNANTAAPATENREGLFIIESANLAVSFGQVNC